MGVQRMDHVGIVVEDLAAATEFFLELGLRAVADASVEGEWVDRVIGVDGTRAQVAMMQTPDGHSRVELVKFHAPPTEPGERDAPANTLGIRHLTFLVDDLDSAIARLRDRGGEVLREVVRYRDIYRLCYLRGPEGIIIELAEEIG